MVNQWWSWAGCSCLEADFGVLLCPSVCVFKAWLGSGGLQDGGALPPISKAHGPCLGCLSCRSHCKMMLKEFRLGFPNT